MDTWRCAAVTIVGLVAPGVGQRTCGQEGRLQKVPVNTSAADANTSAQKDANTDGSAKTKAVVLLREVFSHILRTCGRDRGW